MPSISHLPAELVLTIAEHSLQRHPDECYVVNSADLASLSSTSARLRAILAPLLFTEVAVTTQEQLVALSRVGQARLASTRRLSIFLTPALYEDFKFWGFVRKRSGPPAPHPPSPFDALARILIRAQSSLQVLRIQLSNLVGKESPWSKLFHESPFAVPFSDALLRSLNRLQPSRHRASHHQPPQFSPHSKSAPTLAPHSSAYSSSSPYVRSHPESRSHIFLPNLHTISLDGFSEVHALLASSPYLRTLHMRLSGGFPEASHADLLDALAFVPELRELQYGVTSLRVERRPGRRGLDAQGHWDFGAEVDVVNAEAEEEAEVDQEWGDLLPGDQLPAPLNRDQLAARVELVQVLGKLLPALEKLDLQTRSCACGPSSALRYLELGTDEDEVKFCAPKDVLSSSALTDALHGFKHLKHLALPSTVLASNVLATREGRAVLQALRSAGSPAPHAISPSNAGTPAIDTVDVAARTERELGQMLLAKTPSQRPPRLPMLESLSFIRAYAASSSSATPATPTLVASDYHRIRTPSPSSSTSSTTSNRISSRLRAPSHNFQPFPFLLPKPATPLSFLALTQKLVCSKLCCALKLSDGVFRGFVGTCTAREPVHIDGEEELLAEIAGIRGYTLPPASEISLFKPGYPWDRRARDRVSSQYPFLSTSASAPSSAPPPPVIAEVEPSASTSYVIEKHWMTWYANHPHLHPGLPHGDTMMHHAEDLEFDFAAASSAMLGALGGALMGDALAQWMLSSDAGLLELLSSSSGPLGAGADGGVGLSTSLLLRAAMSVGMGGAVGAGVHGLRR